LILADDLGYGDLGCYGSTKNRSPHIDRLATNGVMLTDFYMSSPVCSPSRAALMTGCYPQRIGLGRGETFDVLLPGDAIGLDPAEPSMPRMFKEGGYRTGMVGKWHLGDQRRFLPPSHGFDRYFGLPYSNDMHPPHRWRVDEGYRFPRLPLLNDEEVIEEDPAQDDLTDRYTRFAIDFITDEPSTPFFLYYAHMYVHTPLEVPQRYVKTSNNGAYGAAVEHLDASVGEIIDCLDNLGVLEDTIIVVTSDNGSAAQLGGSNQPLRGRKFETWEGGVRVPCVVSWPGRARTIRNNQMMTAMDLLPTLAAACGLQSPPNNDGVDLSSVFFEEVNAASEPRDVFYYYNADRLEAVRWRSWKLHIEGNQLYDLEKDVSESTDVSSARPDIVQRLLAHAETARRDLGDSALGRVGSGCRPPGRVADPVTLTEYVPDHLTDAMYD
jgi:arylsulfatase A-like enzyme